MEKKRRHGRRRENLNTEGKGEAGSIGGKEKERMKSYKSHGKEGEGVIEEGGGGEGGAGVIRGKLAGKKKQNVQGKDNGKRDRRPARGKERTSDEEEKGRKGSGVKRSREP